MGRAVRSPVVGLSRITTFVVQTFTETPEGIVAEEPREVRSVAEAVVRARILAPAKIGILAWAQSYDSDTGVWEDRKVLFKAGKISP